MPSHRKQSIVMLFGSLLAVAVIAAVALTQNSRAILLRPAPAFEQRIAYGTSEFQFGELRLPKGEQRAKPYPVAVVLHGGCWMAEYGLGYMGHLSAALAEAGVATWNVEYRRVGNPGGGWPGTFEDVARATDHVRELAKTYPLDLNRVIVIGHSAGGHLALLLAARSKLKGAAAASNPLPLRGVVSLAGITDLKRTGTACDENVPQFLGGSLKEKLALYTQTSPLNLLPLSAPQVIVQGTNDTIIPAEMAKEYAEAAKQKGDPARLILLEQAGHFEVVDPQSAAWPAIKEAILGLLQPAAKSVK